ncbi:hypothetical protein GWI33_010285 [Rhynchophorus ferrugineus]|uniref:Uncharacterized protein n=1 Tax=Rhynchophorus ferrugineus TaxID=354439 RepID=A0A834MLF6_RHYFE|nr:hypothetical protein GWI33_010285 [Rhynchophorus ferrugineus]
MIYAKKEILFTMEELKKRRNDRRREIPVVPRRTRFPKIIKLNEEIITPKDQMRYLGVILYKTKVYINHLNAIKEKVETVAAKMAGPKRRKYGNMARDTMKNVYDRVVKPAILYGFETWGRTDKRATSNRRSSSSTNRSRSKSMATRPAEAGAKIHVLAMGKTVEIEFVGDRAERDRKTHSEAIQGTVRILEEHGDMNAVIKTDSRATIWQLENDETKIRPVAEVQKVLRERAAKGIKTEISWEKKAYHNGINKGRQTSQGCQ